MRTTLLSVALGAVLAGCAGWNNLPNQEEIFAFDALWDPHNALPTADGLYVRLPSAGGLALLQKNGTSQRVELGEGRVQRVTVAPDGETVVAFVDRYTCEPRDPDDKPPRLADDCARDQLTVAREIVVIRDGKLQGKALELDSTLNAITYAEDGRFAVAYVDFDDPSLQVSGVVSLTSIVVLDLEQGVSTPVSIGFAADQALFVHNAAGQAEQAVVLSRDAVAVVDLTLEVPERVVTFPLTLDPDVTVTPTGVDLTPDGRYALVSVDGRSDLYALDLVNRSINIVELSHRPSDLRVHQDLDRTVLVYGGASVVDVLNHDLFEVTTLGLDEPMDRVHMGSDFALLYSQSKGYDVYRLDIEHLNLIEYRMENPILSMHVAPTEEYAIALTRPDGGFEGSGVGGLYDRNHGMEIIDLRDDDSTPFVLEGKGLGVAWSVGEGSLHALVLQQQVEYLFQLDMYTGRSQEIELSAPPVAIGTLPDGTFYITHSNGLGLVSFLDPVSLEVTEVAGFASLGLADPIETLADKEKK